MPLTENSISVIIPTRNRSELLKEALESVLNQSLPPKEIIIIDDHSDEIHNNETQELLRLDASIQIHFLQAHKGVSFCRNLGLEVATGAFVLFLDDDDTLNKDMLKKSIEEIDSYDAVSCRTNVFSPLLGTTNPDFSGKQSLNSTDCFASLAMTKTLEVHNWQKTASFDIYKIEDYPAEHIFLYHPMIHSFLFRRSIFEKKRFPEDLSYGEDFYVWLSLANSGVKFKKLDFIGGNCRVHSDSLSAASDVSKKLKFYEKILAELSLNKQIKNLTFFKMAIVCWKAKKIVFILYLLKAISNPILFVKHARHFIIIHK